MKNLIGSTLGRYNIRERLGQGGMAVVYKAYDTHLECDVAVKVIATDQLPPAQMREILQRFKQEAKEVARLTHPNIVRVTDYGEHEGIPYLVMAYMHGGTLKHKMRQPLSLQRAVQVAILVGKALAYAHEHHMVHRDVKPSNILFTDSDEPMLADFGITKLLDSQKDGTLTSSGVGLGTPGYMAPEQWLGMVSPSVDIYALGIVLYELITGRKPYTADTPAGVMLKQATEPLPDPKSLVAELPDEVNMMLSKALQRNPADRYTDMEQLVSALETLAKSDLSTFVPAISSMPDERTRTPIEPMSAAVLPKPAPQPVRQIPQPVKPVSRVVKPVPQPVKTALPRERAVLPPAAARQVSKEQPGKPAMLQGKPAVQKSASTHFKKTPIGWLIGLGVCIFGLTAFFIGRGSGWFTPSLTPPTLPAIEFSQILITDKKNLDFSMESNGSVVDNIQAGDFIDMVIGSTIQTSKDQDGYLQLGFPGQASLFVAKDTELVLQEHTETNTGVQLNRGRVIMKLPKSNQGIGEFTITSPNQDWAMINGSVMGVYFNPVSGEFYIDCLEGTCYYQVNEYRFTLPSGSHLLLSGNRIVETAAGTRNELWQFVAGFIPNPTLTFTPIIGLLPTATRTIWVSPTPTLTETPDYEGNYSQDPTDTDPTETDRPDPTETDRPDPTETDRPEPTETDKPWPTDTDRPEPTATDKPEPTATDIPQCMDGKDNDNDGLIDLDDRGCASPYDNDESDG